MHAFPRWKYYLLFILILVGFIYALPNIYGDDPAVQIIGLKGTPINQELLDTTSKILQEHSIAYKSANQENNTLVIRFNNANTQIQAFDHIKTKIDNSLYSVALNLVPITPKWLGALGAMPMKLGLDLRGGVRFLIAVDVKASMARILNGDFIDLKKELRANKVGYKQFLLKEQNNKNSIVAIFKDDDTRNKAVKILSEKYPQYNAEVMDNNGDYQLLVDLKLNKIIDIRNSIMEQTVSILRNRVNELGVAEAVVQRQGFDKVVVELPGIQDTARARDLLGKTATVDFVMVDLSDNLTDSPNRIPVDARLVQHKQGYPVLVKKRVVLSGDAISSATHELSVKDNAPSVAITLAGGGLKLFRETTQKNIGKPMAVIYREIKDGKTSETIISVATIQSALDRNFSITGLNLQEARDLALMLRAGSLPANLDIVEERIIGPSMGQENIQMGMISIVVGVLLLLVVMASYYSVFGIIANIALMFNLILLVANMSLIGVTLTLPGIAGIVLTLGMAVDANVLIFERIREELRLGMSPHASIERGFNQAFTTIVDANLTTLIVGIILYAIGTGPVKGFAISLSLGILTSMFTATVGTRALVSLWYKNDKPTRVPVGRLELFKKVTKINFMGMRRGIGLFSLLICLAFIGIIYTKGLNFGLEFTGGTQAELRFNEAINLDEIKDKLVKQGLVDTRVQHYGSTCDVLVRIASDVNSDNQKIADEIYAAFKGSKNTVELRQIEYVGAEVGHKLAAQGALALVIAIALIMVYIALRFEYKLALSVALGLVHDMIIVIGILSLFQIEFDLAALAAVLAVLGYSLNDTIVVFDRVRENFRVVRLDSTYEIMNLAINQTLSRTIMTSFLTALVVISLLIFGGSSLHSFSLTFFLGIVVGTYSSIYVSGVCAMYLGLTRSDLLPKAKVALDDLP